MMDLAQERAQLALTDQHIVEEQERIADQRLIVARVSACGQDAYLAIGKLRVLEDRLLQARGYREVILRRMARFDPALPSP